jgi:Raf kinase inhibitor-like YbhB/YbcL family protein
MENTPFTLSSPVFNSGDTIPAEYTCKGRGISPPLSIRNIPDEANNLALIVHDPETPQGDFLHWAMWNISPNTTEIDEDMPPIETIEGRNDFGQIGYGAPCPPSGRHRYLFDLYALDGPIDLHMSASRFAIEQAIADRTIAKATLLGIVSA